VHIDSQPTFCMERTLIRLLMLTKAWMSLSMQSCVRFSKSQADNQIYDFFHYGALLRLVSSCLVLSFTTE
jgi:hypothetical protein